MIELLIGIVVIGLLFYLVEQIPMAAPFPAIVRVVAVVAAILLVLRVLGGYVPSLNL